MVDFAELAVKSNALEVVEILGDYCRGETTHPPHVVAQGGMVVWCALGRVNDRIDQRLHALPDLL